MNYYTVNDVLIPSRRMKKVSADIQLSFEQ